MLTAALDFKTDPTKPLPNWAGGTYVGTQTGGVTNGPCQVYLPRNRSLFVGHMIDNMAHGHCKVQYLDAQGKVDLEFEGNFHEGERHGACFRTVAKSCLFVKCASYLTYLCAYVRTNS